LAQKPCSKLLQTEKNRFSGAFSEKYLKQLEVFCQTDAILQTFSAFIPEKKDLAKTAS
jgi:hypothetical protein